MCDSFGSASIWLVWLRIYKCSIDEIWLVERATRYICLMAYEAYHFYVMIKFKYLIPFSKRLSSCRKKYKSALGSYCRLNRMSKILTLAPRISSLVH